MKAGIYKTPNGNLIYVAKDRTIKATSLSPSSWPGTKVSHRSKDDTVAFEGYRCTRHADVPNGCTDHQALVDKLYAVARLEPGEKLVDAGTAVARVEEIDGPLTTALQAQKIAHAELLRYSTSDVTAEGLYKRVAEHMRTSEKVMRRVGAAASGAAEATRRFVTVPSALSAPYGEADLVEWRKKFAASLREQGFRICHARSARKHRKQGHAVIPLHGGWFAWRAVADDLYPYQRKTLAQLERYLGVTP